TGRPGSTWRTGLASSGRTTSGARTSTRIWAVGKPARTSATADASAARRCSLIGVVEPASESRTRDAGAGSGRTGPGRGPRTAGGAQGSLAIYVFPFQPASGLERYVAAHDGRTPPRIPCDAEKPPVSAAVAGRHPPRRTGLPGARRPGAVVDRGPARAIRRLPRRRR